MPCYLYFVSSEACPPQGTIERGKVKFAHEAGPRQLLQAGTEDKPATNHEGWALQASPELLQESWTEGLWGQRGLPGPLG
jgi:hypothetical protein